MAGRMEIVIVDVECAGLDHRIHDVVEAAWLNADTGERGCFIPVHSLAHYQEAALRVNQYWERNLDDTTRWDVDNIELARFHHALRGNALVGSNPDFDARFLSTLFASNGLESTPWAPVARDLGTYGAAMFNWSIKARPGLGRLCKELGVTPGNHSAMGDVEAAYRCLIKLDQIRQTRKAA